MWIGVAVAAFAALALAWMAVQYAGARRWSAITADLHARLRSGESAPPRACVALDALATLPAPVQRYLRRVLTEGQPLVRRVRIVHDGTFNLSPQGERWLRFDSEQHVTTHRPGFDWNATVHLARGLPVRVHDAYAHGSGLMQASLFGLLDVARLSGGGAIAEGELMRWLAETPWYPTALLPGGPVQWRAIDERSAEASVDDRGTRVALTFHFGEDGLVERVYAPARGRTGDGQTVMVPWEGRFWSYAVRGGMQVPTQGEVAWHVDGRLQPYWRGRTVELEFGYAE